MATETKKRNFMAGKHWMIVTIILVSAYGIYSGLNDLLKSRKEKVLWTAEDYTLLVDKCIKEAGGNGIKYSELTRKYCECSNDKIKEKFNKQEYLVTIKKSIEDQMKTLLPVFQDCLTEYQNEIKQMEK